MDGTARPCGVDIPDAEGSPHAHVGILQNAGESVKPHGAIHMVGARSESKGKVHNRRSVASRMDLSGLADLAFLASRVGSVIVLSCGDCETHRAHQTHLVNLFAHVDFHFVSAGLPCALWRREHEIAAVVFKRNVHRVLPNHHGGIEAGYRFRETAPEDLESLIVLV